METFELTADPDKEVRFVGPVKEERTEATLTLKNPLEKRVAFKVKCTCNKTFRIRPAVGLLSAGEEAKVSLICSKLDELPAQGKHYFAAYHVDAPEGADDGRKVWADRGGSPDPKSKRIFIYFDDSAAAQAADGDEKAKDDEAEVEEGKEE